MLFQFQYGAIKRTQCRRDGVAYNNFNSNMVRLKVWHHKATIAPSVVFQFQYGAIKSDKDAFLEMSFDLFQFQYGAIKSTPQ